jgi:TPR repeat protein
MNPIQKQLLGWGAAVMLAMLIFPPWTKITHHVVRGLDRSTMQTETQEFAGYSLLFDPPKTQTYSYASPQTLVPGDYYESVQIDFDLFVLQWLTAAFLTAAGLLYFKGSDKTSLKEWWSSPTAAKSQTTTNPPIPTTLSLPISETQVPNQRSKPRKQLWWEFGFPLLIVLCVVIVPHSFWRFLWFGQEEAARRENTSAFESSKAAAEKGDAWAQCKLGWMFDTGNGVPQNYAEAFKWYSAAAQQGDATAQNNLGVMFQNGQAVQRDDVEAYKWYCLSAAQGNTNAKNNRDTLIRSLTPQQIAEAQGEAANPGHNRQSVAAAEFERDFFEKYPDLKAHESVVDAVALKLQASGYKGESREAVMETFAKAAREELVRRDEADHAAEIQLLADKALRYNIDLALKGDDYGEYRMGQRCRDGEDVPKDLKKAREWFIKAAAQGNKAAIKELAHLLEDFPDLSATNNPPAEIKSTPIATDLMLQK